MQRVLLIILGAFLPALILPPMAQAATFVYDAGAGVAIPKTDYQVNPSIPSSQKIVAADWNQLGQAAYDLRQAILTGYYHGLTAQTATPPAPAFGIIIYDMLDGGGLWAEFPDAGTEQVFDGLQQMDNAYVRARAGIDGGITVGHGGVYAATGAISAGEVDFDVVFTFSSGGPLTLSGDAVNGATAVGVILNNDQTLSTAGARIASFRNNNAVKAYVDYGGLGVFDGGVDLGVAGSITGVGHAQLDSLTVPGLVFFDGGLTVGNNGSGTSSIIAGTGTTFGIALTSPATDVATHIGFDFIQSVPLASSLDYLFQFRNNNQPAAWQTGAGALGSIGGFDFDSQKGTRVLAGTASTDAVNVSQLGQATSLAAYVPTGIPAGTFVAAKTALGAGTARTLSVVYRGWGCTGDPCSGWVTYEVKDSTSITSICSESVPACCTNASSGCAGFNATSPVTTCTGTFALNDVLVVDETDGGNCTTQGTAMINFGGY